LAAEPAGWRATGLVIAGGVVVTQSHRLTNAARVDRITAIRLR
jgi:hypothetical protein